MASPTRHIQRLRLRAPAEPLIQRGALLVEDALRTASLPDQRRLLLIRSLDLGVINPGRSAAALALSVEARVAALGAALRYADEPGAAAAPAAFFHDECEPYTLLALRMLRRQAAAEWFWPLALAGWRAGTPPAPGLAVPLLLDLAARHGPAAGVALLGALRRQGALAALLAVLPDRAGPQLLRAFGWPAAPEHETPASLAAAPAPTDWPIAPWVARWGAQQPLSRWLAAVALAEAAPARLAATPQLMQQARALIQRSLSDEVAQTAQSLDARLPPASLPQARPLIEQATPAPVQAQHLPLAQHAGAEGHGELAWSTHAGLFLLLPILARLGMAELLASYPALLDCAFPERLLHSLADRSGLRDDDVARQALPIPAGALAPLAHSPFAMPSWRALAEAPLQLCRRAGGRALCEPAGELVLAAWTGRAPAALRPLTHGIRRGAARASDSRGMWGLLLDTWCVALDRWARRYVELDLPALLGRPGAISATPTHIDVYFAHDQADIRVRSAGVDIDPGWLPWLGRVVSYHYCANPRTGER